MDTSPAQAGAADPLLGRTWYRNYVLAILLLAYILNAVDRGIIAILLEPIRTEFQVSDTLLGLLTGPAFAVFYAVLGVPIAAWADRGVRRGILALAVFLWSGMTALCGMAVNFLMLLCARIGTAVGEAGGTPPSHSLIADYFPPGKRGTALSVYAMGVATGMMLGNLFGGYGAELFGWRWCMILAGVPGVLLAPVILFTIREPPRGMSEPAGVPARLPAPPLWTVFAYLWQRRAFRYLSLACALHAFVNYGAGHFIPPFLMRSHELSSSQTGTLNAVLLGFGAIGTFCGGYAADRLSRHHQDERWYMWLPGALILLMVPFQLLAYLAPDIRYALPGFITAGLMGASYYGPAFAMTQALASIRMRAVAASVFLFIQTLIGLGLGPLFVGQVSDRLRGITGEDSLRYSLAVVALFNLAAAVLYLLGSRHLRQDLDATRRHDGVDLT